MGELTIILFIISKFLWECNLKSFEPRFFLGALTNDNVGVMTLRRDRWKDFGRTHIYLWVLHKMKIFLLLLLGKIPKYLISSELENWVE